jgi:DNA-binding MarR family transcriptional regulator
MIEPEIIRMSESQAAALRRGTMRLGRRMRRERRAGALPGAQLAVLGELHRRGELTPRELADAERVQPQSMTRTLAALERSGLVYRRTDATDRRRARIALTAAGRDALAADLAQRDAWLAERVAQLSPAERAVLAVAAELMERLADEP